MKISIIGGGCMGGATALGLLRSGLVKDSSDITITAAHDATLKKFADKGISTTTDNNSAIQNAEVIIFAVKPWFLSQVASSLNFPSGKEQIIISYAAGVSGTDLLGIFGGRKNIVEVIPNTAIEIGESVTFIANVNCDDNALEKVEDIYKSVGSIFTTDESHLGAGMALASCGLAYAFRYIRAAAEGGVELGIKPGEAAKIVAGTLKGAAGLLEAHNSHPEAEIDKVTTPGGLTIKGLNAMEEAGFTNAVIKGLKACVK